MIYILNSVLYLYLLPLPRKLVHQLPIALLTQYLLWEALRIGSHDFFFTFTTCSFSEMTGIPVTHTIIMSLIRVIGWEWNSVFDVECEFLANNLKGFLGNITLKNSSEESINIFLSCFIADDFFIILVD